MDKALVIPATFVVGEAFPANLPLADGSLKPIADCSKEEVKQAVDELRLYDDENPPVRPKPRRRIVYEDALPGIIGYVFVVCFVAWLAGYSFFGASWFSAGRVDGTLIRDGGELHPPVEREQRVHEHQERQNERPALRQHDPERRDDALVDALDTASGGLQIRLDE